MRQHDAAQDASIQITIDARPIDEQLMLSFISHPDCGAQMLFLGCTRRTTGEQITTLLEYEAYRPMADRELERIASEAVGKWDLRRVAIYHRIGRVPVQEASVAVAVSSPHRAAVMEAIPWIMDQLKNSVPIWKRETFQSGETCWVHP